MIPKIIHLCWFSNEPYPVEIKVCLDTWKHLLPDYKVQLWTSQEAKAIGCKYIDEALSVKKWAFAADAVRFYAVYQYGGVYMDSDIFLYKRFDELIPEKGFVTFNEIPDHNGEYGLQAAFFLAEKGNPYCKSVFDYYKDAHFITTEGGYNETISPFIMLQKAKKYGYKNQDIIQKLDGLTVYPIKYLSPRKRYKRCQETIGCHRIYGSWRKRKFGRALELKIKHIYNILKYLIFKR